MIRYLTKLLSLFSNSSEKPEGVPDSVGGEEKISRFIFSSSHFTTSDGHRVKYAAFMPASSGTASVYRTQGLSEKEIWAIDDKFVSGLRIDGKKSKARGDLAAAYITCNGLKLIPLAQPHPRHTDISSYPAEKGQLRLVAMKLADASTLVLRPE